MVMPHWLPNPVHTGPSHGDPAPKNDHLLFLPDGTWDIGHTINGRPRTLYVRNQGLFGGSITASNYVTGAGLQLGTSVSYIGGSSLWSGMSAPNVTLGSNGDFYFRGGTPDVEMQRIYIKYGGVWNGIV